MKSIVDSAHGGEGWVGRKENHTEEIGTIWGKFGLSSETDVLKHVLLRRPGKEIENIEDPNSVLWTSIMDVEKARFQHDQLAQVYRENGVKVDYIIDEKADYFPNIIFVRDTFTMTSQGAILSRLASQVRAGEEQILAKTLSQLGMPIIASAHNNMILEGPDIVIVNPDLAFLGIGLRTNDEAVKFVYNLLKLQGITEIKVIQTTYGCGHLDGVFNLINSKNAALVPRRASYEIYSTLKRHGYTIIELTNLTEVDEKMSINFITINDEAIVINKGAKDSIGKYRSCGVNCIEVDLTELMKGGGSVHCLTGVIRRECK
ncbi:arginine deiminase family protein [Bacillus sp. JJ1773]|uniref:dimethylarginine dimethylaminohydrolase family protein n=1 Tax=Bacillus sp. JJ1773 TaxID=3122965 RepID=UPI002FFED8C4